MKCLEMASLVTVYLHNCEVWVQKALHPGAAGQ